ncbi:nuclear transport factor 2 family protein [Streptacidiphilus neutrinimicus]|uniref:nuclear transport factor 2 family protein n=1 Tax=Streptacidiphilus neutrinimicus TaxID=105420 RepID=UPI0005AA0974|nr:nuclear transport factor 2 family protein [Streptacidiphilus neutrinimicus]
MTTHAEHDDQTHALTTMLAELACERVVVEFVHRLDLGEPGSVAELFTEDGAWHWPDGERRVEGREALRAYFAGRPADRLSRRLMTNILVTVESPTTARAVSYLTTYRVDGYTGGMIEPRLPANVGHYEDTLRKVDGRWLIAVRTVQLAFGAETERVAPVTSQQVGR